MIGIYTMVITGLFLVPFCSALFYVVIGIRSYMVGKRENNRAKMIGGYNSIAFATLALIAIGFLWYVFVGSFFIGGE